MKRTGQNKCSEEVTKIRCAYLGHNIWHEGPAKKAVTRYERMGDTMKIRRGWQMKNLVEVIKTEVGRDLQRG